MTTIALTLIGKPGCHLCDDARAVVHGVIEQLAAEKNPPVVTLEERSILDDDALKAKYVEDIPVLLVDGQVHTFWRVDATRLRTALLESA